MRIYGFTDWCCKNNKKDFSMFQEIKFATEERNSPFYRLLLKIFYFHLKGRPLMKVSVVSILLNIRSESTFEVQPKSMKV